MFDNFPLWPVGASSHSLAIDLLYIFLVVVSVATTLAIFAVVGMFAFKYRRRHGREAEPIDGNPDPRNRLVGGADGPFSGDFCVGRGDFLRRPHPSAGRHRNLRGRKTVDVEAASTPKVSAS